VSCYIKTKHNVDYALTYSVTLYMLNVSTYIRAALYTGGGVRQGACLAISSFPLFALRLYGNASAFRPCHRKALRFPSHLRRFSCHWLAAARFPCFFPSHDIAKRCFLFCTVYLIIYLKIEFSSRISGVTIKNQYRDIVRAVTLDTVKAAAYR